MNKKIEMNTKKIRGQKRRTWRKYHVSVDPTTHEVTAIELTEANVHDCTVLPALLSKQKNVG